MFRFRAVVFGLAWLAGVLIVECAVAQDGVWIARTPPTSRNQHTAIYDPVRDRMLVLGGHGGGVARRDLWMLSLGPVPKWTPLTPTVAPLDRREAHSAIYDPIRDRMIVYGGTTNGTTGLGDVWAVSLSGSPSWTQLFPTGTPPAGRREHTAIYDPVRDRMVVYGGSAGSTEVWTLSLSGTPAWTLLAPGGTPPSGRFGHSAVYDADRDRMIIFGGGPGGGASNEVWALTLAGPPTWSMIAPAGVPPAARSGHSAVYESGMQRMVIYGGSNAIPAETWALLLDPAPVWVQLMPSNPPAGLRREHSAIYDSPRNRMLVFGTAQFGAENDVQALMLGTSPAWQVLVPGVFAPREPMILYATAYDPIRTRMLAVGGYRAGDPSHAALYAFTPGPPALWTELGSTNLPPTSRKDHSVIYYPPLDALVVFGGRDELSGSTLNQIWTAQLGSNPPTWTNVTPATTPAALSRNNHSAIYDPVRQQMVVFGGSNGAFQPFGDTWAISLTAPTPAWSLLDAGGGIGPSARAGHSAIYHPGTDRMMVFGGDGSDPSVYPMRLAAPAGWEPSSSTGATVQLPRAEHSAIYDPFADRMLVFGGGLYANDTWEFVFTAGPSAGWRLLAPAGGPPSPRAWHSAVYYPAALGGMLIFGGLGVEHNTDVMALQIPGPVAAPMPVAAADTHPAVRVMRNPARGEVDFEVEGIGQAREGVVRICDLLGRTVWEGPVGPGVGVQRLRWNGRRSDGTAVPAGVYFAGVAESGRRPARFVLLR